MLHFVITNRLKNVERFILLVSKKVVKLDHCCMVKFLIFQYFVKVSFALQSKPVLDCLKIFYSYYQFLLTCSFSLAYMLLLIFFLNHLNYMYL